MLFNLREELKIDFVTGRNTFTSDFAQFLAFRICSRSPGRYPDFGNDWSKLVAIFQSRKMNLILHSVKVKVPIALKSIILKNVNFVLFQNFVGIVQRF